MPNIFDGLKKISDKDIIEQIALVETVNTSNISKPIAQKAKKKTISIINFLGSKIGKSNIIEEPEVKEIWDLVEEKKSELSNCTRKYLNERLLNILIEKFEEEFEDPTEDEISIEIIGEAAKLYKINVSLTPSQKADIIYLKYSEKINGKAKEYMSEQSFVDLQETTEDIEEILDNMNEEQRKEFLQVVDGENLTLLSVWKKLDRQHFARLIWLAVKNFGGRFTVNEEILPSFVEKEKVNEIVVIEKDLKNSKRELVELESKIETYKDKVNSIENNLKKENSALNNEIKNKNQLEEDIVDLNKISMDLETVKRSQEENLEEIKDAMKNVVLEELDLLMEKFKKVKFDSIEINGKLSDLNVEITYKNQLIDDVIKKIEKREESIREIGEEFQNIKIEAENTIKLYNEKKEEVYKKEEEKRDEIFERWSKFFEKFSFEFKSLRNVVNFSRKELLHIEECLYELHTMKDPRAISMGVVDSKDNKSKEEYEYIDVIFQDKFKIEIQYKVLNAPNKNVHIVEITSEF